MDFGVMINRVVRAALLDVGLYEEVEADTSLNQEALMVVILVSVLTGIAGFLGGLIGGSILVAILGLVLGVVLWGPTSSMARLTWANCCACWAMPAARVRWEFWDSFPAWELSSA
jgi:hypothetical protein